MPVVSSCELEDGLVGDRGYFFGRGADQGFGFWLDSGLSSFDDVRLWAAWRDLTGELRHAGPAVSA